MDKQTRSRYLRRAAISCTQVLALGSMFAYPLDLISGYQCLAAIVIGFEVDTANLTQSEKKLKN